jgi:hypothetical protein
MMDEHGPAGDLTEALAAMTYERVAGRFALVGFDEAPGPADLELLAGAPGQLVCEGGETSLLISRERLERCLELHPRSKVEPDLVWIRFQAPMGWEVVGFLARVTGALAAAGVPLGAVCGFSRDHLFLHERFLASATSVLDGLFPCSDPQHEGSGREDAGD